MLYRGYWQPNRRLASHLKKHLMHWFWFLIELGIEATNWRAEQAIRPAVVNHKLAVNHVGRSCMFASASPSQRRLNIILRSRDQRNNRDVFDLLAYMYFQRLDVR